MQLTNTLVLCASFVAHAVAQSKLAFTTLPSSVKAGDSVSLKWAGGDANQPVTITLKKGSASNLQTVGFVVQNANGNSYTWAVPVNTPSASDYALQITQDGDQINYTGLFSITGGTSGSASGTSASVTAAASSTPSASANVTTTITPKPSGTAPLGTAGTAGTAGSSISRNTTLSRATLSASSSSASASSTSSDESTSTTSGEGSSSTSSSSPAPSPSGAAGTIASNFGLLCAGIAAVAYLG
ncbi:uncharacterized protein KY384_004167 [Bacidia gigantensis]|uniref:uncharacterized protein n=1 Tax=Bacidia gigantensis TaxID=2732470 RepID=UPI001D058929|nr:uncharacterized protein KY384_004167 [Bacidia gigantensis]KAG8530810.1 hypothetical protein KY384_004167 [Bacidia gigantensis]